MKYLKIYALLALLLMAGGVTMQGQAQKPFKLQVGATGYASWVSPDYLEQTVFDFNDGQLPEGWTIYSEGNIVEPWRFESPATNPQLNFPPDGSTYLYAQSNQLNSTDYMEECFHSPAIDLRGYKRAFVMFDYNYMEDWSDTEGECQMRSDGVSWSWESLFLPWNAQSGRFLGEITEMISHHFEMRFRFKSRYPQDHFAIDNVCIIGETEEPVSNNILGFRLWLDDVLIGDIIENEYQIDTDTLQEGHDYTLSVASILTDGISDTTAFTFTYSSCSNFDGVYEFHGKFIDSTHVELTWDTPYEIFKSKDGENQKWFIGEPDVVTHPGAGYNDGWDVSALHDGLTAYGFNADKEAGFKVMDKFTIPEGAPTSFAGLRFYVFEGPTPISTITAAYLTIYDGDPLNGGSPIGGGDGINCLYSGWYDCYEWAHIYRTGEDDFSDVSRPVFYTLAHLEHVGMGMELEPNHTYWFVASFKGSLYDNVHVIPVTRLGETTTGEARIYSETTGWQPMLDPGTQTQQGIAFDIIGYIPLSFGVAYSDIFRDDELIAHGVNQCYYIDENVPHGIHTYSIQNVYYDHLIFDYPTKACLQSIEVRPCYPPKNLEVSTEPLNGTDELNRLTWDKEDNIPLRDDVKTYYEIYRKSILDNQYALIGALAKDNTLETFEYLDTVSQGTYYYKVNDYNVFPTGSCQSDFAEQYGECEIIGSIAAEAEWSQGTDGVELHWGEDFFKAHCQYENGEFIDAVGYDGNLSWGFKASGADMLGSFVKSVSLYSVADGEYDILIYSGYNSPTTIVWQQTVQLTGVNQWHTLTFDNPYQIMAWPLWIVIHQQGIENPAAYAHDDGSTDDGRWVCLHDSWYKPELNGSFMVRADIDNQLDGEELLQLEEPTIGNLHYNLYRSHDNGSYEKIAQFPYPGYWSHVRYFDPIDETEYSCYNYKVTMTFRDEYGHLCESQPAPNAEDPSIDWAEVCDTWSISEIVENKNLILYPNPTSGKVTVVGVEASEVMVYNALGQLVKTVRGTNEIDVADLMEGVYLVRIMDAEGRNYTERVVVKE